MAEAVKHDHYHITGCSDDSSALRHRGALRRGARGRLPAAVAVVAPDLLRLPRGLQQLRQRRGPRLLLLPRCLVHLCRRADQRHAQRRVRDLVHAEAPRAGVAGPGGVGGHTADGADHRGLRAGTGGAGAPEERPEVLLEALKQTAQELVCILLLAPSVLRVQRGNRLLEVLQRRVCPCERLPVRRIVLGHKLGKAPSQDRLAREPAVSLERVEGPAGLGKPRGRVQQALQH
mmetsp:Transcript_59363/g.173629  ORF Transcript_59363/g.173629 Transcript_59363/m.173629 type:complete len:232 (-) Transcript_59363:179-874(-)